MDSENCILTTTKIKKESSDEDIHEFAETAMNELLGWYGYGGTRDESKMSRSCQSQQESNSSEPESPKSSEGCEWCGKPVDEIKCLLASGATFCSELCFSQSRRANFKKNKTCDWCRHVRHTVSYVDFQDGASQLQFCSDKCLNQYKMHIFCRETRAHLGMHPHLPDEATSVGGLITPDLWLRNCKSPDHTSPSPSISPQIVESVPQTPPFPLIRVAHPSKMMAISKGKESPDVIKKQNSRIQRRNRKRSSTATSSLPTISSPSLNDFPQDLRVRHTPPLNGLDPFKLTDEQKNNKQFLNSNFRSSHLYKAPEMHSNFFPSLPPQPPLPPPLQPPRPNLLPPVTILVPYPIIIPLPLPIPIPVPITSDGKIKLNNETNVQENGENEKEEEKAKERVEKEKGNAKTSEDSGSLKDTTEEETNTKPVRKRKRIAVKMGSAKNKKSVPV